jgi:hypothetical protein
MRLRRLRRLCATAPIPSTRPIWRSPCARSGAPTRPREPGHHRARVNLGYRLIELGQPDEGIAHLRAAVQADPHNSESALRMLVAPHAGDSGSSAVRPRSVWGSSSTENRSPRFPQRRGAQTGRPQGSPLQHCPLVGATLGVAPCGRDQGRPKPPIASTPQQGDHKGRPYNIPRW